MSRNHPFSICPFLSPLSLALLTRSLPVKGRPRAYRRRGIPLVPMSSPRGFWLCHRSSRLAAGCWASPYPLSLHSVSVILTLTHNQRQAGYGTQRRGLETTRTFVDNRPRSLRTASGLCSRHLRLGRQAPQPRGASLSIRFAAARRLAISIASYIS